MLGEAGSADTDDSRSIRRRRFRPFRSSRNIHGEFDAANHRCRLCHTAMFAACSFAAPPEYILSIDRRLSAIGASRFEHFEPWSSHHVFTKSYAVVRFCGFCGCCIRHLYPPGFLCSELRQRPRRQPASPEIHAILEKIVHPKKVKVGDAVSARMTEPTKLKDGTELPKGTHILGKVTEIKMKADKEGPSKLGLLVR